jgi:hypothetical protein
LLLFAENEQKRVSNLFNEEREEKKLEETNRCFAEGPDKFRSGKRNFDY